jgi:formylglycine-generating enzyme required for sulfatase activity
MNRYTLTTAAVVVVALAAALPAMRAEEPKVITNSIGMKLARIPAGSFVMGSPLDEPERTDKERPHKVTLTKPFYMGVYEVTQQEYERVMAGADGAPNRSVFKGPRNPVENVEWQRARKFCQRLSALPEEKKAGRTYRLPTEAEWEYACRAGTQTAFHFGNSLSSHQANFNGNYPTGAAKGPYLRKTTEVGSYKPNAWGLYDMHGNVAEWCADWYDPKYYSDRPVTDPQGPRAGVVPTKFDNYDQNFFVVVRGGSWVDDARACRSAYRFRAMPNTQYRLIGFRVVCEIAKE